MKYSTRNGIKTGRGRGYSLRNLTGVRNRKPTKMYFRPGPMPERRIKPTNIEQVVQPGFQIPQGIGRNALISLLVLSLFGGQATGLSGCSAGGGDSGSQIEDDDQVDDDDDTGDDDTADDDTGDDDTGDDDTSDDDDDDIEPPTYDACFNVSSFWEDSLLSNIKVSLRNTNKYCTTDVNGDCCIKDIQEGKYWVSFKDLNNTHLGSQAGNLNVDEDHRGSLEEILYKLLPQDKLDYLKDTMWFKGNPSERWDQKPKFVIYLRDSNGGAYVSQEYLDIVEGVILNQLNQFVQGMWKFTTSDIEYRDAVFPGGPPLPNGEFSIFPYRSPGGGNSSNVQEGVVRGVRVNLDPEDEDLETLTLQEGSAALVNGAETHTYTDSAFYDPYYVTSVIEYSDEDLMFSAATYGIFKRSELNYLDENNLEDKNSSTYDLN